MASINAVPTAKESEVSSLIPRSVFVIATDKKEPIIPPNIVLGVMRYLKALNSITSPAKKDGKELPMSAPNKAENKIVSRCFWLRFH